MPQIRISVELKTKLDELMTIELQTKVLKTKGEEMRELFKSLITKKTGLSYNDFLEKHFDV